MYSSKITFQAELTIKRVSNIFDFLSAAFGGPQVGLLPLMIVYQSISMDSRQTSLFLDIPGKVR